MPFCLFKVLCHEKVLNYEELCHSYCFTLSSSRLQKCSFSEILNHVDVSVMGVCSNEAII